LDSNKQARVITDLEKKLSKFQKNTRDVLKQVFDA
jgi:hypothetical protein